MSLKLDLWSFQALCRRIEVLLTDVAYRYSYAPAAQAMFAADPMP